jgi:hypothetical protein
MGTFACLHTVHARAPRIIGALELATRQLKLLACPTEVENSPGAAGDHEKQKRDQNVFMGLQLIHIRGSGIAFMKIHNFQVAHTVTKKRVTAGLKPGRPIEVKLKKTLAARSGARELKDRTKA